MINLDPSDMQTGVIVAYVHRADHVGELLVPRGEIQITSDLPSESHEDRQARFERDATSIRNVLRATLPGGTFYRLTVLLLRDAASDLVVRRADG